MKPCKKCGETKPLTEYYKLPSGKDGFMVRCKSCDNERRKARYRANKGEEAAVKKAYYAANREHILAESRKKYEHSPELAERAAAAYLSNRAAIRSQQAVYAKNNPHIFTAKAARRRARKLGIPTPQTKADKAMRMRIDIIAKTMTRVAGELWSVDHMVPVSKPGSTDFAENCVAMPAWLNSKKRDKVMPDAIRRWFGDFS